MDDRFTVSLLLVVVAVLATVASTTAQDIVFPEVKLLESCSLPSGERGRCLDIRSCSAVHETLKENHPNLCGFNASYPIVCCPDPTGIELEDIAAPSVNFECGQNTRRTFELSCTGLGPSQTLRPRAATRPSTSSNTAAGQQRPRIRPGIPEEALLDDETRSLCARSSAGAFTIAAVGGVDAVKNAWPWMALIGTKDGQGVKWFCGGVLINDQWVLTALHCFLDNVAQVVRLGEHDYNDDNDGPVPEDFQVAETILYPGYTLPEAYHDLTLLRLTTKVTLKSFISPVCLPWGRESSVSVTGQKVTLTGWGDTAFFGFPSSVLQEVSLTVFPSSQCDTSYSSLLEYPTTWPQGIGEETVCAGDPNGGKDACQGDSGGPIVSRNSAGRYTLAGIVSQGYGCGLKDYPGLYANVRSPAYLAWIKKVAF